MTFRYYKARKGEWRFRLVASNGETVAQSEGYKNKKDCLRTINLIREYANDAKVEQVGDKE